MATRVLVVVDALYMRILNRPAKPGVSPVSAPSIARQLSLPLRRDRFSLVLGPNRIEMNVLDQFPRIGVFLDQMGLEATLVQMPATAVAAKRNGCCKSSGANRPRGSDWRAEFGPARESDCASGNTYGLRTRNARRFLQASRVSRNRSRSRSSR